MRTWKRILGAILVFVLVSMVFPVSVSADRVSDIRQELNSISNELIQISQELSLIAARTSDLSKEVSQLAVSISVPGANLQAISNRLSQIQTEANNLSARKTELDNRKSYLASRVSTLQREVDALTRQTTPPVVSPSPPVIPSPVVNPPITSSPIQAGAMITGTLVPSFVRVNERSEFRVHFEGAGPEGHIAAATIRKIGGHEEDWQRIVLNHDSGYAWWKPFFYQAGDYQIIFGIWKGDTPVTNSGWISFRVKGDVQPAPAPVTSPPTEAVVSGEITNTAFPATAVEGETITFRMDFRNSANASGTLTAAMTIRYPDGHEVDYGLIPVYLEAGGNHNAAWQASFPPGNYRVIFGLWDGGRPLARSYWMDFSVTAKAKPVEQTPTPPVSPPPTTSPTNPSTTTSPATGGPRIAKVVVPQSVFAGVNAEFVMHYEGTTTDGTYIAAATIKYPDGSSEDWSRIPIVYERHTMTWGITIGPFGYSPGDYQIIFGIWRGDTPITNSGWIPFRVYSDSTGEYEDMDGTATYVPDPETIIDDDSDEEGESWADIQNKTFQVPFGNRYVYLSPKTHFLFEHRPAISPYEALITEKTIGLTVSVDGVEYYPIDLISSLGGSVRYEGDFIAVRLGENEALLDLQSQTVIAADGVYPIDPVWHQGNVAVTAESVNLPAGFYRGFFGIHPARMSIYQEDTAYAEEFGNAHDEGPALIRDWVIGSVSGHFIGKAATILVSRAVSAIATRIVVSGISREAVVIATVEAERTAISSMMRAVLSRLPKATTYEISLATEKRLLARAARATSEKAERGILGEVNLVRAFRKLGIEIHPDFNHLYRGFDNVGRIGEKIVIGEAKYVSKVGQFTLSDLPMVGAKRQMDNEWIEYASGLLEKVGKTGLSKDVVSQLESGSLKRVLVITRPSGKPYGISDDVLTIFDEVIEVDLSGVQIARYIR